jgi:hypothetical protein
LNVVRGGGEKYDQFVRRIDEPLKGKRRKLSLAVKGKHINQTFLRLKPDLWAAEL